MKTQTMVGVAIGVAAVCGCLVTGPYGKKEVVNRTVDREWFDHYQEKTPCFNPGTTVCETDCSDSKGLVFEPQSGIVHAKDAQKSA